VVTGVELIGTPLTMFSNILSASKQREVFTGFCGAESGKIPVTTIAPAIFVKKIETKRLRNTKVNYLFFQRRIKMRIKTNEKCNWFTPGNSVSRSCIFQLFICPERK
jgi:hypothetical protein